MKKFPVVFDLETKYTFREYDDPKKLGITVVALYDYNSGHSQVFEEKELPKLFPYLEGASYIIGFNINSFDIAVLKPYYPGNILQLSTFDILDDIRRILGRRLALNDLISATLNKKKTAHGLQAIEFYKEGKWKELKQYCLDDVMLTKELFEYGVKNKEIYFLDENGKVPIHVNWEKYMEGEDDNDVHMTLPF